MKTYIKITIIAVSLTSCINIQNSSTEKQGAPKPKGWEVESQPNGPGTIPISFKPTKNLTSEITTTISIVTPELHKALKTNKETEEIQAKAKIEGRFIDYAESQSYLATYISAPIKVNNKEAVAILVVPKPNETLLNIRKDEFLKYVYQFSKN